MELLKRLDEYSISKKDITAFINGRTLERITYGELKEFSDSIASYIKKVLSDDNSPIIVYGHKDPLMIVLFIACVKAGHPYCPVDISIPDERLTNIIEVSGAKLMFALENTSINLAEQINLEEIKNIIHSSISEISESDYVKDEDIFYIIFTSGSTGRPKGVQITANCLDNYLAWMMHIGDSDLEEHNVYLNQAPYSFDLSVMDTYTSLYSGGTIWSLDKKTQENLEGMYSAFAKSGIGIWVSTPSFINMCFISNTFNENLLPQIHTFLFCGEILTNRTVLELKRRFPRAKIVNTYGPTESTVAVTEIIVSQEMAEESMTLSIGKPRPGTQIFIMNDKYEYPGVNEGEKGEIVICGDTVAKGYLNQPELTADKFFEIKTPQGYKHAYKTGDEGYMQDGFLYYVGRMDFQLKINGYRIELGDIESNILKFDGISCCTIIPIVKNGENKGLAAFITGDVFKDDEFETSQKIRKFLMKKLPPYMIPKKYIYLEEMPMTNNGKVNRKKLETILKEKK